MKGNQEVIDSLNARLVSELSAIVQYKAHVTLLDDWHFKYLKNKVDKRSYKEMDHALKLVERIVFLEGTPVLENVPSVVMGQDVPTILMDDREAEMTAIQGYNESIELCTKLGDNTTAELLEDNLEDEEKHINWIESQLSKIQQMTLPHYLKMITDDD